MLHLGNRFQSRNTRRGCKILKKTMQPSIHELKRSSEEFNRNVFSQGKRTQPPSVKAVSGRSLKSPMSIVSRPGSSEASASSHQRQVDPAHRVGVPMSDQNPERTNLQSESLSPAALVSGREGNRRNVQSMSDHSAEIVRSNNQRIAQGRQNSFQTVIQPISELRFLKKADMRLLSTKQTQESVTMQ